MPGIELFIKYTWILYRLPQFPISRSRWDVCLEIFSFRRQGSLHKFNQNHRHFYIAVYPFSPVDPNGYICKQCRSRWDVTTCLIRIHTVCHCVIDVWLKPAFATMPVPKFKDGKIHELRCERVKLKEQTLQKKKKKSLQDHNHYFHCKRSIMKKS